MTDLMDACEAAADILVSLRKLRSMAEAGNYPELLKISSREYRVRREDHEAWKAKRWTGAVLRKHQIDRAFVKGDLPVNRRARCRA